MAKQGKKKDIHERSFSLFMDEFVTESDRAAVILGAAKIEALLGQILDKHLLPSPSTSDDLLEGDAPLATFSSKIKICHRLGIIDTHFCKLLNTFRRLRNGFAHEVTHSTLDASAARDRVLSLAEPFTNSEFFQSLLATVAAKMDRLDTDPGVVFRSVLALFHIHLASILRHIETITPHNEEGIIDIANDLKAPSSEESA